MAPESCIGLDIETSKKPNHLPWKKGYYLSCLSISYPDDTERTWTFYHNENKFYDPDRHFREIQAEIDKYEIVAAHNAKFELNNLRRHLKFKKIHCSMVAEYLINYQSKKGVSLDDCSVKYGLELKDDRVKKMWNAGKETHEIPLSILVPYCEMDAKKSRLLYGKQLLKIYQMGLNKVYQLQMRWSDLLSAMETRGMGWDMDKANEIVAKYRKYDAILESKLNKLVAHITPDIDINLASNDDLSAILYGGTLIRKEKRPTIKTKNIKTRMPYVFTYANGTKKIKQRWINHPDTRVIRMVYTDVPYVIKGLGISPLKGTETAKSTEDRPFYKVDKDTLPFLQSSGNQKTVIKLLLKKSSVAKLISTFSGTDGKGLISKIGTDGRLHTNYNQSITSTGRLSSSDPNSQNFPRSGTSPIKSCIIPLLDEIMNGDLSQVEWRIPAQMSGDPLMIQEIVNGMDCHSENCKKLMQLPLNKTNRTHTKIFNFRMIFRGSAWGYHRDPKMPAFGIKKWKQVVENFWNKYVGLDKWHQKIIQHVIDGDGTLSIFTGRRFRFKLNWQGKYNESQISNAPVQGFAGGDLLPLTAVIIWDAMIKRNMKSHPILTVHDSIVFDVAHQEREQLADLLMLVFTNLPQYIKQYWGYNWIVPMTGEVEVGRNYGNQKQIRP
jgi:DNA polymerase I-like protein with 3'-5' exonuclease and polymerase domains